MICYPNALAMTQVTNAKGRNLMSQNPDPPELPQPDPTLKRLDRVVGTWTMEGDLVGSEEKNIKGETTFRWLPGGFFLEQRAHIDFAGVEIDALRHQRSPHPVSTASTPGCGAAPRIRR
jgi:hypothetical protein